MQSKNTICAQCGKEAQLTIIDEETQVCEECLDTFYTQCDECGEYWDDSYVEFFALKDGRLICEHCAEDLDEDEFDPED